MIDQFITFFLFTNKKMLLFLLNSPLLHSTKNGKAACYECVGGLHSLTIYRLAMSKLYEQQLCFVSWFLGFLLDLQRDHAITRIVCSLPGLRLNGDSDFYRRHRG